MRGSASRNKPDFLLPICIAAASGVLAGRMTEARRAVDRLQQLNPNLCISNVRFLQVFDRPEDSAKWIDGLRKAGLPE
jgi:hypothetical protein